MKAKLIATIVVTLFLANILMFNVAPVKADITRTPIDIQSVANKEQVNDPWVANNPDYGFFGAEPQTFIEPTSEVPFVIGNKIIILNGGRVTGMPSAKIDVYEGATKIYFLGQVAGWTGGAGSDAAPGYKVASYVINFVDGTSQTVDLILGDNIDEWSWHCYSTSGDITQEVMSGPNHRQFDPTTGEYVYSGFWHLDMLTITLDTPKIVTTIDFIDEGNNPAPVLFAITVEFESQAIQLPLVPYAPPWHEGYTFGGGKVIMNNPTGDAVNLVIEVAVKGAMPNTDYVVYLEYFYGMTGWKYYALGILHTNGKGNGNFHCNRLEPQGQYYLGICLNDLTNADATYDPTKPTVNQGRSVLVTDPLANYIVLT